MNPLFRCVDCGTLRVKYDDTWPTECHACGGGNDSEVMPSPTFTSVTLPPSTVSVGVLSGRTIRQKVDDEEIVVNPEPTDEQFQPASLDVRLGAGLYDVAADELLSEPGSGEPVTIEPGRFYLGHTLDVVYLPENVIAILAGRSTIGRLGVVVHKTAGIIDPGFEGDVTLEMYNFSERPITFQPGERVAQLVFMYTDRWTRGYDGKYAGQRGPTPADR